MAIAFIPKNLSLLSRIYLDNFLRFLKDRAGVGRRRNKAFRQRAPGNAMQPKLRTPVMKKPCLSLSVLALSYPVS